MILLGKFVPNEEKKTDLPQTGNGKRTAGEYISSSQPFSADRMPTGLRLEVSLSSVWAAGGLGWTRDAGGEVRLHAWGAENT